MPTEKIIKNNSIVYKRISMSSILYVIAILSISFSFFFVNLDLLSSYTFSQNDVFFEADTFDTANAMRSSTFFGDMMKHPLFSVTTHPLVFIVQKAINVSQDKSICIVLAFLAALNITGVFFLLNSYFTSKKFALLFTVLFAFFFSNLVIFSIPETYCMSNLMIIIYLSILIKFRDSLNVWKGLLLSILTGIASLYNPPLLSLLIIHIVLFYSQSNKKDWISFTLSNIICGGVIFFIANYSIHGIEYFNFFQSYSSKWGSVHNYLDLNNIATVIVNFFFFSILSPVKYIPNRLGLQNLFDYLQSPLGIIVFSIIVGILCYSIYKTLSRSKKTDNLYFSLLVWILIMVIFYIYFNPQESLLYSSQILLPVLLFFENLFETIQTKSSNVKIIITIIIVLFIGINNFLSIYSCFPVY